MGKTFSESFTIRGEQVVNKIKELVREGNIRKITINDKDGKEIMSFPLTIGVVGVVIAPVLAAIGAAAALIGDCSISVEREVKEDDEAEKDPSTPGDQ
ncbi:MAG: DUF4342 domain-containing protein [Chitinophagaceae bacterium]|nr:DUF4342 domain-containing protein [Chitinophagaceae bacterium]MCW5927466.1 DUF4342 domain-containing protein [Chitinophagaceae bacterium]